MIKQVVYFIVIWFCVFSVGAQDAVDINRASAEAIAVKIIGIGPAKARAIVKYREINGPYQSIDELLSVNGIGKKTLEKIRPYVILSSIDGR